MRIDSGREAWHNQIVLREKIVIPVMVGVLVIPLVVTSLVTDDRNALHLVLPSYDHPHEMAPSSTALVHVDMAHAAATSTVSF